MTMTGIVTDTSSFELDLDGWTTGGMDQSFTTRTGSAVYHSYGTGPSGAAVGSYYAYAFSYAWPYYQKFDLQKTFSAGQELYGIAFQYHMYGYTIGSAVLESSANGTSWAPLWSQSGNKGNQWLQATVYAGDGQTMLRYTCVCPNKRGELRATRDE